MTIELGGLYTSIEEAKRLIHERWENKELRAAIEERFGDDMPMEVFDGPSGMIGRHIGTPDREFARFLDLAKEAGVKPLCFELTQDKFVARNFTKLGLTSLPFMMGLNKNGKTIAEREKIIDFNHAEGKNLSELKTLWGEPLVDFHHWFLLTIFPIMKKRVVDIHERAKQRATPKEYYPFIMELALAHLILFDDFDLLATEDSFTNEVVIPSFMKVESEFGLRPLVVKISNPGEHAADPYWWCYAKDTKDIMEEHKLERVWR